MAEEVQNVFSLRLSSLTAPAPEDEYLKFSVWFVCLCVQSLGPCVSDRPGHDRSEQARRIVQVSERLSQLRVTVRHRFLSGAPHVVYMSKCTLSL